MRSMLNVCDTESTCRAPKNNRDESKTGITIRSDAKENELDTFKLKMKLDYIRSTTLSYLS